MLLLTTSSATCHCLQHKLPYTKHPQKKHRPIHVRGALSIPNDSVQAI
jgi:hypothetical protein